LLERNHKVTDFHCIATIVNDTGQGEIGLRHNYTQLRNIEIVLADVLFFVRSSFRIRNMYGWTNYLIEISYRDAILRALTQIHVLRIRSRHEAVIHVESHNHFQIPWNGSLLHEAGTV